MPTEAECLREYRDCFYGLHGRERDYVKAAHWVRRGHGLGYLNCTAELASCYEDGYGVPRDGARALELARGLVEQGFAPAWRTLATLYAEGHGVPLDRAKALDCSRRLLEALAEPVAGVDEELRRSTLMATCSNLCHWGVGEDVGEYVELGLRVALENAELSDLPNRYALLASALLRALSATGQDDAFADDLQHVINVLRKGEAEGDAMAMYMLTVLLRRMGIVHARVPELMRRAAESGQAALFGELMRESWVSPEEAQCYERRFWDVCNLGVSCLPREGALPCRITLERYPFIARWEVRFGAPCYRVDGRGEEIVRLVPDLVLHHEGGEDLAELQLRLCSADAGVDARLGLDASLKAGETRALNLRELERRAGRDFGESLHVELHSGGRCSRMSLSHTDGLSAFYQRSERDCPPMRLWWERGMLGGCVLRVAAEGVGLTHVSVWKHGNGASAQLGDLKAGGAAARAGWREFSDRRGLKPGEAFAVCCNEYPPILARLAEA